MTLLYRVLDDFFFRGGGGGRGRVYRNRAFIREGRLFQTLTTPGVFNG